ncbi:tyrosine-type recombinase/integrase [Fusibacillus kribbianus]|uniref:Tyrosine-type recombinase/integrase n=1 Tax=Fusibacillus kribbianus TaxID=3044208 RepID=A0AAP4B9W8_9FIRM|nr:tyrosine-type recombinase/integrase [Ruminococcus sp. YH-rum2234]MDI9241922.1 tyrosine-type recombinase/integrase [Ruminococcus sp. YH-rum2234]
MRKNEERLKYLAPREKEALFDVINQDHSLHAIRNQAIFHIAKYCALRVSEIGLLQISDYNPYRNSIHCQRLKGSCSNTLRIIDPVVSDVLNRYLQIRKSLNTLSPYLFLSQFNAPISRKRLDGLIKQYGEQAQIPPDKCHFHVLKHTRGVELADAGLDMREIQYWLGHKNMANSQRYLSYTDRQYERIYTILLKEL